MFNAMKYIRDLEAVGFQRNQAEAQVQLVLDAIEGDLVSKSDFAVFGEQLDSRLTQFEQRIESRFTQSDQRVQAQFTQMDQRMQAQFTQVDQRIDTLEQQTQAQFTQVEQRIDSLEQRMDRRFIESELRIVTRLGFLVVSSTSIAVAALTWLIKLH